MHARPLLLLLAFLLAQAVSSQTFSRPTNPAGPTLEFQVGVTKGNAPLYVLRGDRGNYRGGEHIALGLRLRTDISASVYAGLGVRWVGMVSSYGPSTIDLSREYLVAESKYLSLPVEIGTRFQFQSLRFEFAVGCAYSLLMQQREWSVREFSNFRRSIISIDDPAVHRHDLQMLTSFGLNTPISTRISSFLGLQANIGFVDQDRTTRLHYLRRLELQLGLRYHMRRPQAVPE